ncbi:ABC transporter ATP-binding protein [Natrarchaeobius sp. A-rgal3]|uniref:ABC transporter ATP-binding protein n=1 Tax=Natrarchaeobius versutus TaxID=1679078 RepID=UPI00351090C3
MNDLLVDDVNVHYGDLQVLWDVSLEIRDDDDVVALIGPNGAGKSTLLKAISGVHPASSGTIEIFGTDTTELTPSEIVRNGFVQVPEARNLFDDMSVYDNLKMGAYTERGSFDETVQEVYEMFPILEERRDQKAGTLSGGQQQMVAIGRSLMTKPKLLALDEPSGALAPQLADRVFEKVEEISDDITVLLVEQHVDKSLALADRGYLLENGRVEAEGTGDELLESEAVKEGYLSV